MPESQVPRTTRACSLVCNSLRYVSVDAVYGLERRARRRDECSRGLNAHARLLNGIRSGAVALVSFVGALEQKKRRQVGAAGHNKFVLK